MRKPFSTSSTSTRRVHLLPSSHVGATSKHINTLAFIADPPDATLKVATTATPYQNDDVLPLSIPRRTWTKRTFIYFWLSICHHPISLQSKVAPADALLQLSASEHGLELRLLVSIGNKLTGTFAQQLDDSGGRTDRRPSNRR